MEGLREILYPLGFLSSIVFFWRFIQQWITSELHQKSLVTRSFWQLSFIGNVMLMLHAFLQLQYHVCAIQACNAIISWRNLDLMREPASQASFRKVIVLMLSSIVVITLGFVLQGYFLGNGIIEWFRTPNWNGTAVSQVGTFWHLLGFTGLVLFSSRFWVQWWEAEKDHVSSLSLPFWWLSVGGGTLSLFYFIYIEDLVNIIGPAFGMIPYIRNLMLIYKAQEGHSTIK